VILNCLIFFYQSKQLTDYIYTDIYCKLSKYIGQTPCSYEHYLVINEFLLRQISVVTAVMKQRELIESKRVEKYNNSHGDQVT